MASLVKLEAKHGFNCTCCSERVRTCEKYLQVKNDSGTNRRCERYCLNCEQYAHMNNEDIAAGNDDDGEAHLRSMEDFAAYRAAGVSTDTYFSDRDAGYAN